MLRQLLPIGGQEAREAREAPAVEAGFVLDPDRSRRCFASPSWVQGLCYSRDFNVAGSSQGLVIC